MSITFSHPDASDLTEIMRIEQSGFTPDEAATRDSMAERIKLINDTFIIAKNEQGQIMGYVVGPAYHNRYLADDLFDQTVPNDPKDSYIAVLSLVVLPDFQGQHVASQLLSELDAVAKQQQRTGISLTCLENLIPFYERNSYVNEGVSDSTHADETWYNLVKVL